MVGLSGCLWSGLLTPAREVVAARLRRGTATHSGKAIEHADGEFFGVSLATKESRGIAPSGSRAADGAVQLLLDGWVERPSASRHLTPAMHVLEKFRSDGIESLRRMNGIYNILLCDEAARTARVITSSQSYLPLFVVVREGAVFLAPEIRALLAAGACKATISDDECFTWLLCGRYLRDETKFADVKLLPTGSMLTWADGAVSIDSIPKFQYQTVGYNGEDNLVADLADTFRAAVHRRMEEDERVALGLSGGFDSRLILAAIDAERRSDVFTFTWGTDGNDDMRLAGQVARAAGAEHQEYPVDHLTYLSTAREGVLRTDGLSLFVHGFYPGVYESVRRDSGAKASFNGVGLDVLLGGLFLKTECLHSMTSRRDWLEHYRRTEMMFSREEFTQLCRKGGDAWFDGAVSALDATVSGIEGERIEDVNDQFHFETRTRRWIALAFPLVRSSLETIAPCYDQDFLRVLAQVQPSQRFNRRLYVKLLCHMNAELSRIDYQKTMMPACLPSDQWRPFVDLEQQRERAHYELWKQTDGEAYVPYNHYPQNFVEWYRVHSEWRTFLRDTLLGSESVLIDRFFERSAMERLIAGHLDGSSNRFRQLNLLVSLELFFQLFQDFGVETTAN